MTAVLYTPHFVQFFDNDGDPLAGGLLYTYEAGTTTPKATYADFESAGENSNPVVLDSAGRAKIFIDGSYRFVLHDADDVPIANGTTDNVTSFTNDIASGEPGDNTVSTVKIVDEAVTPAKLSPEVYTLFDDKVLSGLVLSNNTTDATNDIDTAIGACVSDDGTTVMTLTSAITKRLDAAWSVGTNQGGLDTGSISNTTYHVWVIYRTDTDITDVLFSLSASSPTMPSGYTKKKCIGSIVRVGGVIKPFTQYGNYFEWVTPVVDVDDDNPGTSAVTRTLTLPTGVKLRALVNAGIYSGTTASVNGYLSSLDQADLAVQARTTATLTGQSNFNGCDTGTAWNFNQVQVWCNVSAQIRSRIDTSGALDRIGIITQGWIDPRI